MLHFTHPFGPETSLGNRTAIMSQYLRSKMPPGTPMWISKYYKCKIVTNKYNFLPKNEPQIDQSADSFKCDSLFHMAGCNWSINHTKLNKTRVWRNLSCVQFYTQAEACKSLDWLSLRSFSIMKVHESGWWGSKLGGIGSEFKKFPAFQLLFLS